MISVEHFYVTTNTWKTKIYTFIWRRCQSCAHVFVLRLFASKNVYARFAYVKNAKKCFHTRKSVYEQNLKKYDFYVICKNVIYFNISFWGQKMFSGITTIERRTTNFTQLCLGRIFFFLYISTSHHSFMTVCVGTQKHCICDSQSSKSVSFACCYYVTFSSNQTLRVVVRIRVRVHKTKPSYGVKDVIISFVG